MKIRAVIIIPILIVLSISVRSQVQIDSSDAVWSIVNPITDLKDIDLGQCIINSAKDSVVDAFIINQGSIDFLVDTIFFQGADADVFSLVSGSKKFILLQSESKKTEFRFQPLQQRVYTAEIVIITQADTLKRTIRGEGVRQQLQIMTDLVDFGNVEIGDNKDKINVLTLKNVGTIPVQIVKTNHSKPNDIDFSTLAGGGSFTLNPNDTAKLNLRFSPSMFGKTCGVLEFHYIGAGSPSIVQLFGEGIASGKPQIITESFVNFKDSPCSEEVFDTLHIKNNGSGLLNIKNMYFSGSYFSLSPAFSVLKIKNDSTYSYIVKFSSNSVGKFYDTLTILSNSITDSILKIPFSINKELVEYKLSSENIQFFVSKAGETEIISDTITNTGSLPIKWDLPGDVGKDFSIYSITPIETPPNGGISIMKIVFNGGPLKYQTDTTYFLKDPLCGKSIAIKLSAFVGADALATLQAGTDDITSETGDIVNIPIFIRNTVNLVNSGTTGFKADLRYNASLLSPVSPTPEGQLSQDGKERIIELTLPINPYKDSTLQIFTFKATLGDDSVTALVLENLSSIGGLVRLDSIPGLFTLKGICRQGGTRLVTSEGQVQLKAIHPNPANETAKVEFEVLEHGKTQIIIFNSLGTQVMEIVNSDLGSGKFKKEINLGNISSGTYFVMLKTMTQVRVVRMEVMK